jgi:hypothetical protein
LSAYVAELVREGEALEATKRTQNRNPNVYYTYPPHSYVDLAGFRKWQARLHHLTHLLGDHAAPWKATLTATMANEYKLYVSLLATLKAIQETLAAGLLVRVEDLVRAEAFDSLLEQGEYLLREGYTLAAGVLGRAVLEEHLRALCHNANLTLTAARPTLVHLYQALEQAKLLTAIDRSHVQALATIGNAAAHNQSVGRDEVERLLRDVRDFLLKHPT